MEYVIFIIIAYLLGSIPSALIVGKIGYNIDVREHGSKNMGATNAFRVLGKKAGIIVTISDILKGTLATIAPLIGAMFMDVEVSRLLIGIFAVIGHTYPIFAKFKGGKAVATSGGVILGINPLLFLAIVATFLITLKITKYVSLSSMLTGVIATIISAFLHDLLLFCMILFLTIFVIIRHRENIKRIKNKTEPKITWM
ncbi:MULTISPECIES: glycerol-3-phosphate 1-O-acyltransferase PlsY [unclassified Pseudogracilibacillus]|uniref:Glycerol-3-phosphate acyltransferase n=1 Tax=Candidatus Pseudogracilibacillus intestinigallinarum TaxID=2838742 RepID=A0A9D1TKT8_9BACI|nr:glycerol-3-phosphate 1-O-acyltransferase PlsY [Candidatus Pseudogracilibacillus intestinigallinarum]